MQEIRVILDWFANTNHTGFFVAEKLGYFQDANISVQISGDVHGVLDTHGADFVLGPEISILEKIAEGVPLTTVATLTQRCDSGIVSLKESGITSPKQLEGKRLTHWAPKWFHAVIGEAMRLCRGDYEKVRLVPMDVGDIVSTLGSEADATWVYENWENQELVEAGREINYFALADIDPLFDFCAPSIAGTHAFLNGFPEETKAFLHALSRGYVYAAKHPAEAVLLIRDCLPDVSDALLVRSQKHLSSILLDAHGRWGTIQPSRWDPMADWMIANGFYDRRRETEYTNAFLPAGHL